MDLDNSIRNIMKEITRECTNKGIQIHENFLKYYLNLLTLNPIWGISSKGMPDRIQVQSFINFVVNKLQDQLQPEIITLKMQFFFNCNMDHKDKVAPKNREGLHKKLEPLQNEILDTKTVEDATVCYKKIIYYITLASGLGNPILDSVFDEVDAALRSILNIVELEDFMGEQKVQKQEQLDELVKLVAGIRLFNRDCDKGGEGIEDLPKLLTLAQDMLREELQQILIIIMDKVNLMTTALDNIFVPQYDDQSNQFYVYENIPSGSQEEDVEYVKDYLILFRQFELYIRKLIELVETAEDNAERIFISLSTTLLTLHQTVRNHVAIPVVQVFPLFTKLADIWFQLQDETVFLSKIKLILKNLVLYIKQTHYDESITELLLNNELPMTDAERLERTSSLQIDQEGNLAKIMDPESIDKSPLQYLGFCPWKLVETQGALIPGNPNMGVAKFIDMHYVFSCLEGAEMFGKLPSKWIFNVVNLARLKPQLINFMDIKQQLSIVQDIKELIIIPPVKTPCEEVEVQTETHLEPDSTVKNYKWNIWDYKREAIQLANLVKRRSVSVQTKKTYGVWSIKTQTQEKREKNAQTKKDNYSNVPKPSTYIFGLRGRKDNMQFIVELTRPVEK